MPNTKFIPQLEALRGIAALCVVAEHSFVQADGYRIGIFSSHRNGNEIMHWLTHVVMSGRGAVLLFFVLSGYVLKLQWDTMKGGLLQKYASFAVRRMFRIMPAVWVSISISYALIITFHITGHDLSLRNVANGLLLRNFDLNLSLWSVSTEITCSLILPILLVFNDWAGVTFRIICMVILSAAMLYSLPNQNSNYRFLLAVFYGGVLIHNYGAHVVGSLSQPRARLLMVVAFLVYGLLPQLWVFAIPFFTVHDSYYAFVEILPCLFIVAFVVHRRDPVVDKILLSRPVRFIGRISFSLYVLHYMIIQSLFPLILNFTVSHQIWDHYYWIIECCFFVCVSSLCVCLSVMLRKFVELPMNRLGHTIGRCIESFEIIPLDIGRAL